MDEQKVFKTVDVDLASYLSLKNHTCSGVEISPSNPRKAQFIFMDSPGLQREITLWFNGGAREFKRFGEIRYSLYQWARDTVRSAEG